MRIIPYPGLSLHRRPLLGLCAAAALLQSSVMPALFGQDFVQDKVLLPDRPVTIDTRPGPPAPIETGRLFLPAPIAFHGTVVRLQASNLKMIVPHDRTALVHVDDVVSSTAPALQLLAKHDVTLELLGTSLLKVGDQELFLARPWSYGENVALVEQSHRPVTDHLLPRELPENRNLIARLHGSYFVVTGTVQSIRPPLVITRQDHPGEASKSEPESEERSEHDPHWMIAQVAVQSRLSGHAPDAVTVYFPTSRDVVWYQSPRLTPGQNSVFILRALDAATGAYTATNPEDVQPLARVPLITNLLQEVSR